MPPNSNNSPPTLLLQGLDSLYVSYFLAVLDSDIDFDELAYQQERLKQSRSDQFAEIGLGTERFALKPYGRYPYRYVLANEVFEVRLAEHLKPACHVQFFSAGLWMLGLDALCARFSDWCNSLKLGTSKPEVVARADWAFDYGLPSIDFELDHFRSRAAKSVVWHEYAKIQTFAFGVGNTVIRVYDKIAEIEQQSSKAWFYELWGQEEGVWRIEFQVRKERLKRGGVRTIDDLKDYQNDLLRELAQNHTSLRTPVNDTNQSRWPLHPLWRQLLRDIGALPQTGLIRAIDPEKPLSWRLYQQGKSVYGMIKGMGALLHAKGQLPDGFTLDDVLDALGGELMRHHREPVWARDIAKRINALELGQW